MENGKEIKCWEEGKKGKNGEMSVFFHVACAEIGKGSDGRRKKKNGERERKNLMLQGREGM